jgi:hypothetical protein
MTSARPARPSMQEAEALRQPRCRARVVWVGIVVRRRKSAYGKSPRAALSDGGSYVPRRGATAMTRAEMQFWRLGTDYYIAGRSALFLKLVRIYGNIYHHAIETLLKAGLSREISLHDLRNPKKFGHDLDKLWPAFKAQFNWDELNSFDQIIKALHHFEDIRYPDKILQHGATIQGSQPASTEDTKTSAARYGVNKHDLDRLVAKIFFVCGITPDVYFSRAASFPYTREMIVNDNPIAEQLLTSSN